VQIAIYNDLTIQSPFISKLI